MKEYIKLRKGQKLQLSQIKILTTIKTILYAKPYFICLCFQVDLIKCLEAGLKLKCAQQCVDGLTLCVMEMQDTMIKILPSVILEMSKMSATPTMAIPVLEFLSSK